MKKMLILIALLVLLLILDNAVMPFVAIKGYYPSLVFIFVICYSIVNESWSGLLIGLTSGLMQDVYFFRGFGINSFTNIILCVVAGEIGKAIFKEKLLVPMLSVFVLTLLKGIMVFIILYACGMYSNVQTTLFNGIYSFIIGIFMYRFVYKLCQKEYMMKKWNF